jgi:hypothetical protein
MAQQTLPAFIPRLTPPTSSKNFYTGLMQAPNYDTAPSDKIFMKRDQHASASAKRQPGQLLRGKSPTSWQPLQCSVLRED